MRKDVFLSLFLALFVFSGTTYSAVLTYEAEKAKISNGVIATDHTGYSGTGFVDYNNQVGSYVEWTINLPSAGTYHMDFRYANGTANNRPMEIRINSTVVNPHLAFIRTGSWNTWQNQGLNTQLKSGSNIIRATSTTTDGGPNVDKLSIGGSPLSGTDWGKAVVDSTIARYPDAASLGTWHYSKAFFLYGAFQVYKRIGDDSYLTYMKNWVDSHIDSAGNIDFDLNSLDNMQGGNLFIILYELTGQSKYKSAAGKIRARLDTYPRTSDGGFYHMTSKVGQLWLDGAYMLNPFLARYGQIIGDKTYTQDEAAKQLIITGSHLKDSTTGLYYHAYDEEGDVSWADPTTHHSCCFWGRALGWYTMATVDVLDVLSASHPKRAQLLSNLQAVIPALTKYQSQTYGRWFQVVDQTTLKANWLETSASAMFTYAIARSAAKGYVSKSTYQPYADKGYKGVLSKLSIGSDGLTNLIQISDQSGVGDLTYYLNRPKVTNSLIGIGAFLVMNELLTPRY